MDMLLDEVNNWLKVIMLIGITILFFLLLHYKTHHCDLCQFEWNGKVIDANTFVKIYSNMCLNEPVQNSFWNYSVFSSVNNSLNSKSLN